MALSRLESEVNALDVSTRAALKNPFLPAPVRDAIAQANYVIRTLALEVLQLKGQVASNGDTINGELRAMRELIGSNVTRPAELGGR
jgi:hypothetical protein